MKKILVQVYCLPSDQPSWYLNNKKLLPQFQTFYIPIFNTVPESWPSGCASLHCSSKSLILSSSSKFGFRTCKKLQSLNCLPDQPVRFAWIRICARRRRNDGQQWLGAGSGFTKSSTVWWQVFTSDCVVHTWYCHVCTKWKWQISGARSLGPPFGPLDFVKFAKPNNFLKA